MKLLKNILIQPKSILLIFIVIALLVISSALIELNQSKKEMLSLMEKQSNTLLETLLASSANALLSSEKLEDELKQRLLNNALLINDIFDNNLVTNSLLEKISIKNNLFRINIFNKSGKKIYSSNKEIHRGMNERSNPKEYLAPIFNNEEDTIIIGVKPARFVDGARYVVAVATRNRDAIVVNVDADELLKFRKQIGFGVLLKEVVKSSNIIYAILQDKENIIAAAGKEEYINPVDSNKINLCYRENSTGETINGKKGEVFEACRLFTYGGKEIGLFRLGLSMEPVDNINSRITRRIIIISILLFAFGSFALAFVFVRQNFLLLSKKYKSFEEYSHSIINNTGEAIILLDNSGIIKSANPATEAIFGAVPETLIGKEFTSAFGDSLCGSILQSTEQTMEVNCVIKGINKTLLISKNAFHDENREENVILVIKDLTKLKELEIQSERNERLAAMGELASAVAHEIRNPLNSISTIVQQLNKDFEPKEHAEEYNSFTKLVYSEVNRINTTIENFLKFARPLEITKEIFTASELIKRIEKQYSGLLNQKKIVFKTNLFWDGEVEWDKNQLLQVFINIIENSIDSIKDDGEISLRLKEEDGRTVCLSFSDTGCGMDEKTINKIFNLYFTTKAKGNGIGLSIVQKIIASHNGRITVESETGKGTTIHIFLPKFV